jgi:hypothetical protein
MRTIVTEAHGRSQTRHGNGKRFPRNSAKGAGRAATVRERSRRNGPEAVLVRAEGAIGDRTMGEPKARWHHGFRRRAFASRLRFVHVYAVRRIRVHDADDGWRGIKPLGSGRNQRRSQPRARIYCMASGVAQTRDTTAMIANRMRAAVLNKHRSISSELRAEWASNN